MGWFKGKILFLSFAAIFLVSATASSGSSETNQEMVICKAKCEQIIGTGQDEKPRCMQTCESYHKEKGKWERDHTTATTATGQPESNDIDNNPYVFDHFTARLETEHAKGRFHQKFTDRSELFQGIEKYRSSFLELEPLVFVQPSHWDADDLGFVCNGQATITLIEGNKRRSYNIKRGDLFLVPAGITMYLTNTHHNERFVMINILRSVSVPGELEFFSAGHDFFSAFSHEVLEAAFECFNVLEFLWADRESTERMFGQQKVEEAAFKKATPEHIRSLAVEDKGRTWPFGERKEKYVHTSIYKKEPSVANENGILHEFDSKDFTVLKDINVAFSFFNITQGSMMGPFYNTKATQVLMVVNGVGRFEMACPQLSEQASGSGEIHPRYKKVSSELRRGMEVVIPAGHPVVIEAFGEQNLEVVGFGLNSDENEWFPLAGRENVMSQWEDAALELNFGIPAREVQRMIQKQHKKLFFKAPVRTGRALA